MVTESIRVALADDHAVVRTGYRRLLELETGIEVVAEFGDTDVAYGWLTQHEAEVLILDLSMPGRGGLETLQRLGSRLPGLRVLVFSMHDSPALVAQALKAGARGYLTKSSPPEALVDAVQLVMRGERPLSDDVREALGHIGGQREEVPHLGLSPREFDVFRLLAKGRQVDEIAGQLFLSIKTVANYQTMLRKKMGLGNALEMHRYARQHGLL
ncbi:response regulator [Cupriavidus basilensis]|uniref:response regulator n=1 Tax=Cupriavidus basilensis TaxID=68895 RepID=UPI0020A638F5|nr:response regulator transcription factor [Cupriavidus basilensis]MCP3023917.1 response regulator transcription factor [Cupriavidus basilensis]MDR3380510.1 response regulator transcription factor [Cupriavidus basilensis]